MIFLSGIRIILDNTWKLTKTTTTTTITTTTTTTTTRGNAESGYKEGTATTTTTDDRTNVYRATTSSFLDATHHAPCTYVDLWFYHNPTPAIQQHFSHPQRQHHKTSTKRTLRNEYCLWAEPRAAKKSKTYINTGICEPSYILFLAGQGTGVARTKWTNEYKDPFFFLLSLFFLRLSSSLRTVGTGFHSDHWGLCRSLFHARMTHAKSAGKKRNTYAHTHTHAHIAYIQADITGKGATNW